MQVQGRGESPKEGLQIHEQEAQGPGNPVHSCDAVPLGDCQEPTRESPSPHRLLYLPQLIPRHTVVGSCACIMPTYNI